MIQNGNLKFACDTDLVRGRFVSLTVSTGKVAYTSAGARPDGVTLGDASNGAVAVHMLGDLSTSFWFEAGGSITAGTAIQVSTNGVGITATTGYMACIAKTAGVSGSFVTGYSLYSGYAQIGGTANTGVTAVEYGFAHLHRTVLTVNTTLPAIAGGANLAVGKLLYTLPAGEKIIRAAYMSLAITQTEGNINADTPDGGLGTVIGSGAVDVLGGTGTFEDILTGQTFNNCTGTAEVKSVINQELLIATASAHTVHFNVADGWAASGDAAAILAGTVILAWEDIN